MDINFLSDIGVIEGGSLALSVSSQRVLSPETKLIDERCGGVIERALLGSYFTGKRGDFLEVIAPEGLLVRRLFLFGVGDGSLGEDFFRELGGRLGRSVRSTPDSVLHVVVGDIASTGEQVAAIAYGIEFSLYEFSDFLTERKDSELSKVSVVNIYSGVDCGSAYGDVESLLSGVYLTRDLVSQPPNILYPESFAERCLELRKDGLEVTIFDESELAKRGFGALLGVGQGSHRESRVVIMRWLGASDKKESPLAFIGKGVTFDSGGISLKPGPGMEEMKWDMAGAGVVTGLMKSLALSKAGVNAVGIIGLVENMPDGNAQRPGDIVRSYSGKTIEIHNTDAEGRLVLADLLSFCEAEYSPRVMIDLATLTGAIVVALGHEHAGLFSNDDDLSRQLADSGIKTGEKLWRMPLHESYNKLLRTTQADMKNIGGRTAGSITAAQFLGRFVERSKWAHLDIAGVAWWNKACVMGGVGASGFGVSLLRRWVRDYGGV